MQFILMYYSTIYCNKFLFSDFNLDHPHCSQRQKRLELLQLWKFSSSCKSIAAFPKFLGKQKTSILPRIIETVLYKNDVYLCIEAETTARFVRPCQSVLSCPLSREITKVHVRRICIYNAWFHFEFLEALGYVLERDVSETQTSTLAPTISLCPLWFNNGD